MKRIETVQSEVEKKACGLCCTKIYDISVSFGQTRILHNINLHFHCGDLTALIGPNGAGKSTLLKAILGEIKYTGKFEFLDAKGEHSGRPVIGYVPQKVAIDPTTPISVQDLFTAALSRFPAWIGTPKPIRKRIIESLERVKAAHLLHSRVGNLSGGELQRVMLALALNPVPDLLLLDEPVSGVDHNGMELFYQILSDIRKNFDLTILLVSHDLDLVARHATRAVLIDKTVIASGSPKEVLNNPVFLDTFGLNWAREMNGGK